MSSKIEKNNKVLFDPGFAPYVLVFSTTYEYVNNEVRKFKNAIQRKSKYHAFEAGLHKLCDNVISFYLGCILYGAYIKNKYKNAPKELDGNDFYGLNYQECLNSDANIEVLALEKFIKNNDRNPFASKKLNPKYIKIIDNYIEFLKINNFFTNTKTTNDINIPEIFSYINNFDENELEEIIQTIFDAINSKKPEKLLTCIYFVKIL